MLMASWKVQILQSFYLYTVCYPQTHKLIRGNDNKWQEEPIRNKEHNGKAYLRRMMCLPRTISAKSIITIIPTEW